MTTVEYDPDPMIFPSQAWFAAYENRINDDPEYEQTSQGWGVDFDGDFIFEMTEMPIEAMNVDAMPDYLRDEMDTYLHETDADGYVGYAYLGLEDGRCTDAYLVEDANEVDTGFHLTAPTEKWKSLLKQEQGIIDGLMSGDFDLDGDMQKVLQYSDAAVRLTDLAGSIGAEYADERFERTTP